MSAYVLPVVLQLLGLVVIVVEIFVPSFGLLTALAAGLLLYSLYLVFTTISANMGLVFVGVDMFVIPVILALAFKALGASSWSLHKTLSREEGVASQSPDLAAWGREKRGGHDQSEAVRYGDDRGYPAGCGDRWRLCEFRHAGEGDPCVGKQNGGRKKLNNY